jgi:hypothetical protein
MTVVEGSGQTISTGHGFQGVAMSRKQAGFSCDLPDPLGAQRGAGMPQRRTTPPVAF